MARVWYFKALANINTDPTTTNNHLNTSSLPETTDMTRGMFVKEHDAAALRNLLCHVT